MSICTLFLALAEISLMSERISFVKFGLSRFLMTSSSLTLKDTERLFVSSFNSLSRALNKASLVA